MLLLHLFVAGPTLALKLRRLGVWAVRGLKERSNQQLHQLGPCRLERHTHINLSMLKRLQPPRRCSERS